MSTRFLLAVLLPLVVVGCARKKITAPLLVQWEEFGVVLSTADQSVHATGRFEIRGMRYEASFHEFPRGTRIAIGPVEQTVDENGRAALAFDIAPRVGDAPPNEATTVGYKVDPSAELVLTFEGGFSQTLPLRPMGADVGGSLCAQPDRPTVFGAESSGAPAAHTVWVCKALDPRGHGVLGPAATMRDVDLVAVVVNMPARRGKRCALKTRDGSMSRQLEVVDQEARVYERKTGRLVKSQLFTANDECPIFTWVDADKDTVTQSPSPTAIKEWLATQYRP